MAAKKLYITQPAVTAQVKLLEDYCNLKLFKKKGRRLYLTDEGKTLYDHVRNIFKYEKEIESVIEEMRELKRGVLRLGTSKAYARYFMPTLLTHFREAHPHIRIHLDEGSAQDMIQSLLDLENEVAFIAKVEDHPSLRFIPFSHEELVLVVPPNHRLASYDGISLVSLADEPIIMKERGSGTRKLVDHLFEHAGVAPNILMETSNTEFIKELVQRGDGVSFVIREAVAAEIQEKKLTTVPIEGERFFLDVSIAYLKNQPLSRPAQAFLANLPKITPGEKPDQGIRAIMAKMLEKWK